MRSILAIFMMAIAMPAAAQQQDEQLWLQVNTNVPLGDRYKLTLEQIARFGDRADGLYQTEFGGLLSYKLAPHVELGFGYRYVGAHNGNTAADENRIRQQVVATFGRISTRLRLDERFHPAGSDIGFRVRPLVRYTRSFGGAGWGAFASHESFILPNTTSWGQRAGYDRMRNVVGLVVPIARRVSADVGYLNQYRFGHAGARDQMDHALSVQLNITLPGASAHKVDD